LTVIELTEGADYQKYSTTNEICSATIVVSETLNQGEAPIARTCSGTIYSLRDLEPFDTKEYIACLQTLGSHGSVHIATFRVGHPST
jgi:hypothetical protein